MSFTIVVSCDGPGCTKQQDSPGDGYPPGWMVVDLMLSPDALGWKPGQYSFHDTQCFTRWTHGKEAAA